MERDKGSTDQSVTVAIIDSTAGTPETGVTFETAGIALWYRRQGAAVAAITEVTLANAAAAHADGGFVHISDGIYRLDLPDAAFATGVDSVAWGGTVTGMIVIGGECDLKTPLSSLSEQAAAFLAAIADGTGANEITVKAGLAHAIAMASGNFTISGNAVTFKDRDGDDLFTLTLTPGVGRTRS